MAIHDGAGWWWRQSLSSPTFSHFSSPFTAHKKSQARHIFAGNIHCSLFTFASHLSFYCDLLIHSSFSPLAYRFFFITVLSGSLVPDSRQGRSSCWSSHRLELHAPTGVRPSWVLGCTGSVEGSTGWYMMVLGQYRSVLIDDYQHHSYQYFCGHLTWLSRSDNMSHITTYHHLASLQIVVIINLDNKCLTS